jgi:hypothetical protein
LEGFTNSLGARRLGNTIFNKTSSPRQSLYKMLTVFFNFRHIVGTRSMARAGGMRRQTMQFLHLSTSTSTPPPQRACSGRSSPHRDGPLFVMSPTHRPKAKGPCLYRVFLHPHHHHSPVFSASWGGFVKPLKMSLRRRPRHPSRPSRCLSSVST